MNRHEQEEFKDAETAVAAQAAGEFFDAYLKANLDVTRQKGTRPTDLAVEKEMGLLDGKVLSPLSGEPVPYSLEELLPKNPTQQSNEESVPIEIFPGSSLPIADHATPSPFPTSTKRIA